jgi:hypothetical protein
MLARMTRCAIFGCALASAGAWTAPLQTAPADRNRTVWDGVYTSEQAARGRDAYEADCRTCDRDGPRKDEPFMRDWGGSEVNALFDQIKMSMPASAPSSLSDASYFDIIAYLLEANAFPAGSEPLDDGRIAGIRIEGREVTRPVPNFALVASVGCLAQTEDKGWRLTGASEPVRTKNPEASGADERAPIATPASSQTFGLMNIYPAPDRYNGHMVEAKGFLIRDEGGDRINVTSIRAIDSRCDRTN